MLIATVTFEKQKSSRFLKQMICISHSVYGDLMYSSLNM